MRCGVLALQGDYEKHAEVLRYLGHSVLYIKKVEQFSAIDLLVMPGGESTAMLKLMSPDFFNSLQSVISDGLPVFATCAGLILLANEVTNPKQNSLALLDLTVERNSYGSQIESQILNSANWNNTAIEYSQGQKIDSEIILIRAPRIVKIGAKIQVLLTNNADPLLVKSKNIIAATFHPELSSAPYSMYSFILSCLRK